MALKGTLKDFGIADIFQLIGHQSKTGTLFLRDKDDEVAVSFVNGNVVAAQSASRKKKDLLGRMLMGAGLLTQEQLDDALEQQKKTLTRLGDILVEKGYVTREELREITQLQVTETIYRLFAWKSGTYEFVQQDVDYDETTQQPIRSETILMDGFRMVDEWPMVKKTITSFNMTFLKAKELPPALREGEEDDFDFGGGGEGKRVGKNERRVYALASPGRTVQEIIDRSRLGEFETCKALYNLVQQGYLTPQAGKSTAAGVVGEVLAHAAAEPLARLAVRAALTLLLAAGLIGLLSRIGVGGAALGAPPDRLRVAEASRLVAALQAERLATALEIYRLENKEYPEKLDDLVQGPQALVRASDLRYPWAEAYYYRRTAEGGYVLLPPLR